MTYPLSDELRMTARYANSQGLLQELVPISRERLEAVADALDASDELQQRLEAQTAGRKRALDLGEQALSNGDTALAALEALTAERDELRRQLAETHKAYEEHLALAVENLKRAERAEAQADRYREALKRISDDALSGGTTWCMALAKRALHEPRGET